MLSDFAAASVMLDSGAAASPVSPPHPWPDRAHRAAQRSAKYQAVLAAAARLFCVHGFQAAALDDVAARLQVSKPTLYYYVRSKKALVEACAHQGLQNALYALETALEGVGVGLRLKTGLAAYAQVVASDFGWCMVRAPEFAPSAAATHDFRTPLARYLATAAQLSHHQDSVFLLQAVEGVACTGGRRADPDIAADVDRLLARIFAEGERPRRKAPSATAVVVQGTQTNTTVLVGVHEAAYPAPVVPEAAHTAGRKLVVETLTSTAGGELFHVKHMPAAGAVLAPQGRAQAVVKAVGSAPVLVPVSVTLGKESSRGDTLPAPAPAPAPAPSEKAKAEHREKKNVLEQFSLF